MHFTKVLKQKWYKNVRKCLDLLKTRICKIPNNRLPQCKKKTIPYNNIKLCTCMHALVCKKPK